MKGIAIVILGILYAINYNYATEVTLQKFAKHLEKTIWETELYGWPRCSCPEYTYTCPRIGQVFSLSSYMGEYRQEVTTDKTELERNYRKSKM